MRKKNKYDINKKKNKSNIKNKKGKKRTMKNQENIEYTYKHRKIVKYLAEKYIQKNKKEKIKQIVANNEIYKDVYESQTEGSGDFDENGGEQ